MKRSGQAVWQGDGLTGKGNLTTQSGVFKAQPYSFNTRFKSEDGLAGTNPEELIAVAHAGCFTMALSFMLAGAGYVADELQTEAQVELQQQNGQFTISAITLNLQATIPGISDSEFQEIAHTAKANCPVSKALAATPMTLNASLRGG
ncbi:OsmC family protein [Parvibium lacunae]|uniref:OsmC family peroxiredoxin n=1 Tax=Parvibium lacunae TaxID=1888893 RepID=A0A368L073_9BURK|nr:OsmC family protein [Parvibium lacunae]RCS56968.1 OsmC family peroxiredoxin [Parvibium lacunae]